MMNSECEKILIMLAQRKGSKFDHIWYGDMAAFGYTKYKCFICGDPLVCHVPYIYEHGIQHLREKNLLPFV